MVGLKTNWLHLWDIYLQVRRVMSNKKLNCDSCAYLYHARWKGHRSCLIQGEVFTDEEAKTSVCSMYLEGDDDGVRLQKSNNRREESIN